MTTASSRRHSTEPVVSSPSDAEVALLREHRATAQRALRAVLGVSADEEDLIQEVLTRLVIRLRQPGEIAVGAWTWRVAHNLAVDHVRARRPTATDITLLDRGVGDGLDTQVIGAELAEAISLGLAKLPDRQRDALLAQADLDGGRGGHAIVAANLGVSSKAAESILARARRSLRRELDRVGVREGSWVFAGVLVLRSLRRLLRPKAAAVGLVTIAAISVVTASALVFRIPLGRRPPPTPPILQESASVSRTTAVPTAAQPSLATAPGATTPTGPAGSAGGTVGTPPPSLPSAPGVTSASVPSAVSLPPVQLPVAAGPELTLPPVTIPSELTLPPVTIPSELTLPAITVPPVIVLGKTSLPSVPSVSLPAVPPVTVLGQTVLPGVPSVTTPAVPSVVLPAVTLPAVSVSVPPLPLGLL